MSQSTLHEGNPGGSPLKTRLVSWSVAVLRASKGWLRALDQILRGETTRPSALREQSLQIPIAGLSLLILALALCYGFCMGMYPGCRIEGPIRAAMAGLHAEDTGPLPADPVRHLSFAVRGQCPGRIAAAVAGGLATSRGGLGREPGGPGVGRPDRGLLFVQHDEQRFHVLAQRPGVRGFRASGHGLSAANAAPPEHDSQRAAAAPPSCRPSPRKREGKGGKRRAAPGPGETGRSGPVAGHVAVVGARPLAERPEGPAAGRCAGCRRSATSAEEDLVRSIPWKAASWAGT